MTTASKHRLGSARARRLLGIALTLVVLLLIGRPAWHLASVAIIDYPENRLDVTAPTDARRQRVVSIARDSAAAEAQLRELLAEARLTNAVISVGDDDGAISSNRIVLDLSQYSRKWLDTSRMIVRAQSGATWLELMQLLDLHGLTPFATQEHNGYRIGASIGDADLGMRGDGRSIAEGVESFRIMLADGSIHRCSRSHNSEIFSAVVGGGGLPGIVLDVELRVVPNARLDYDRFVVSSSAIGATLDSLSTVDDVEIAYARLRLDADERFADAIVSSFRRLERTTDASREPAWRGLRRLLYIGAVGSDYGKELRWNVERWIGDPMISGEFSRSQLVAETPDITSSLPDGTRTTSRGYLIPIRSLDSFLRDARRIVDSFDLDPIDATLRLAAPDTLSLLANHRDRRVSVRFTFALDGSAASRERLKVGGVRLIDAALGSGGSIDRSSATDASSDQLARSYPLLGRFIELKTRLDSSGLFQNGWYRRNVTR